MTHAATLMRNNLLWAVMLASLGLFAFVPAVHASSVDCTANPLDPACTADEEEEGDTFGFDPVETSTVLGNQDLRETVSRIINVALGLLGIVAVVIVLIGGGQILFSNGDESQLAAGRQTIFLGVIGIAVILSAFAIATFVLGSLSTATGTGSGVPQQDGN